MMITDSGILFWATLYMHHQFSKCGLACNELQHSTVSFYMLVQCALSVFHYFCVLSAFCEYSCRF